MHRLIFLSALFEQTRFKILLSCPCTCPPLIIGYRVQPNLSLHKTKNQHTDPKMTNTTNKIHYLISLLVYIFFHPLLLTFFSSCFSYLLLFCLLCIRLHIAVVHVMSTNSERCLHQLIIPLERRWAANLLLIKQYLTRVWAYVQYVHACECMHAMGRETKVSVICDISSHI